MLRFQSFLGFGICIQRRIIGNSIIHRLQAFVYSCHVFNVFKLFLTFFNIYDVLGRGDRSCMTSSATF